MVSERRTEDGGTVAAQSIRHVTALRSAAHDALECGAHSQVDVQAGVEQIAIARVADHQPVLAVVADEAFGDAFDRLGEPLLAAQPRLLGAPQRRDVVEPEQPLATGHRDMAAGVGDLNIGDQQIEGFALLVLPNHFLVQELATAQTQQFDDARSVIEVVPESLGVEEMQFFLLVAKQVAHPPVVKQDPPLLVDDADRGRTVIQDLAKLALLFENLRLVLGQRGHVVNPQHALAADEADVPALVGDLCVSQQHMKELAVLAPPDDLLIQQLPAPLAQRRDDSRALFAVVPERAGVDAFDLGRLVAEQFAQPRVVEQQAAIFIDHQQGRGAELQHLVELALVFGRFNSRSGATIGRRRSRRVGRHAVSAGLSWRTLASRPAEFESPLGQW